jgi:AcrR family transcriptional regulator
LAPWGLPGFCWRTDDRENLLPQRSNGRERVGLILQAAVEVINERGYEAATMKEIADRSSTKIGSLYRFFPTKELVAEALIQLYADSSEAQWQAIIAKPCRHSLATSPIIFAKTCDRHQAAMAFLKPGLPPITFCVPDVGSDFAFRLRRRWEAPAHPG